MGKRDDEIVIEFYKKWRAVIKSYNPHCDEGTIDLLAFLEMLKRTNFPPADYYKMFKELPDSAKKNILKKVGATEEEFKEQVVKSMATYRQDVRRIDLELDEKEFDI